MQNPEDSIEPGLISTFQQERSWLSSHLQQISLVREPVPQIPQQNLFRSDQFSKMLIQNASAPQNDLLVKENNELRVVLRGKQEKIEDLCWKITNEEVNFESWKKMRNEENEVFNAKIRAAEENLKTLQDRIEELIKEKEKTAENEEILMLRTKIHLLEEDIKLLKLESSEKSSEILKLQQLLSHTENEKLRALDLFQNKEQRIREEIESSYSFTEMQQKIEYYSKKMKEFQHMYLEIKSYETIMLKVLEKKQELEALVTNQDFQLAQVSTAYTQLKQDYEFLSIKLKSVSDLLEDTKRSLDKETFNSQHLATENLVLQRELTSIIKRQQEPNLMFTSVEEILIKNTHMNVRIEELQRANDQLDKQNLELKRRIYTFEWPKQVPEIENEEIPQFECNLAVTREQFIEKLCAKNEILMAQAEYFAEKLKLAGIRENSLLKENEKLEQNVRSLTEKFYRLQVLELGNGECGRFEEQIKALQVRLQVAEEIGERSGEKNKRMREMMDCLNEYCKRLEVKVGEEFIEGKSVHDQVMREVEVVSAESLMEINSG